MKLKNFKDQNRYTLIKLHLLKHQIYKNNISKISFYDSLNFLELNLKRILNLIHLYNSNNKKILFIGFPYPKNKRFFKRLGHLFLPKNFGVHKKSINTNEYLFRIKQKLDLQKINMTIKNYDLIVFFNPNLQHIEILQEFKKFQVPVVLIGDRKKLNTLFSSYSIFSFTLYKITKQLFFFLICASLQK